jgi:hypothetical protein
MEPEPTYPKKAKLISRQQKINLLEFFFGYFIADYLSMPNSDVKSLYVFKESMSGIMCVELAARYYSTPAPFANSCAHSFALYINLTNAPTFLPILHSLQQVTHSRTYSSL